MNTINIKQYSNIELNLKDTNTINNIIKSAIIDYKNSNYNSINIVKYLSLYHKTIIYLIDKLIRYTPNYMEVDDIYLSCSNHIYQLLNKIDLSKTDNPSYFILLAIKSHIINYIKYWDFKSRKVLNNTIDIDLVSNILPDNRVNPIIINSNKEFILYMINDYINDPIINKHNHVFKDKDLVKNILVCNCIKGMNYKSTGRYLNVPTKMVDNLAYRFRAFIKNNKRRYL
jgi:hypothetical protein